MDDLVGRFDKWLKNDGPAALVIREHLMPVEGRDGVVFPATFASGDRFLGGYNIDEFPGGTNVCLIDSVGSQANRIEPLFAAGEYAGLIPQVVVVAGATLDLNFIWQVADTLNGLMAIPNLIAVLALSALALGLRRRR